jgi:murein DD-endopeptidase MepM/ murein hydrolase activator NlpD
VSQFKLSGGYTYDPDFLPLDDEDDEDADSTDTSADADDSDTDEQPAPSSPAPSISSSQRSSVDVSEFGLSDFNLGDTKRGVKLSSVYGPRTTDIPGASTDHKALDLAVQKNTPVYAVLDGQVTEQGYTPSTGNYIKIRHDTVPVVSTRYLHFASPAVYKKNARVNQDDEIGYVGNTGTGSGPHLHFEVYDQNDKRLDPLQWLKDNPSATFPVAVTD